MRADAIAAFRDEQAHSQLSYWIVAHWAIVSRRHINAAMIWNKLVLEEATVIGLRATEGSYVSLLSIYVYPKLLCFWYFLEIGHAHFRRM